jgi:heptosyltransferase III
MNWTIFKALWLHRYRKYTYICKESCLGWADVVRFWLLKIRTQKPLIAIVRTEHFGDIVAAEPIARQVRALHPNSYIVWVVKPVFRELVENHPEINETWPQSSVLRRIIICKSGVFDVVYNLEFWQSNHDTVTNRKHENLIAAQNDITIFNYFGKGNLLNIFQTVGGLPIQDTTAPQIYISDDIKKKINKLDLQKKLIVIHCNSNFDAKDWTVENWERLIDWLIGCGFTVAEIGLKSKNNINNPNYTNLSGQYSILETAEIISKASYFVGIDSGPAHLANAVGVYGILLIGRLNNFEGQMPYSGRYQDGSNATIIRQSGRTCAEFDYESVKNQIAAIL